MTVLHTGSTKKFSANWGNIFGGGDAKPAKGAKAPAKKETKPAAKAKAPKAKAAKPAKSKKAKK